MMERDLDRDHVRRGAEQPADGGLPVLIKRADDLAGVDDFEGAGR